MSDDAVLHRLAADLIDEGLHLNEVRWKQHLLTGVFLLCREHRWYYLSLLCVSGLSELGPDRLDAVFGGDLDKFLERSLVLNHRINHALALSLYSKTVSSAKAGELDADESLKASTVQLLGTGLRLPARRWNLPWTDRWYSAATLVSELDAIRAAALRTRDQVRKAWSARQLRNRLGRLDARLKDGALMRLQRHAIAISEPYWKRIAGASSQEAVHIRIHYSTAILEVSSLYKGRRKKIRRVYLWGLEKQLGDEARREIDSHFGPRMLALKVYELMRCLHRHEPCPEADSQLKEFYDLLLRDILDRTDLPSEARPTLVIATHGVLAQLPFSALFDGSRYLIERFNVTQAAILRGDNTDDYVDADALTGGDLIDDRQVRVLINTNLKQSTLERGFYRNLGALVTDLSDETTWDAELFGRLVSSPGIAVLSTHTWPDPSGAARTLLEASNGELIPFAKVLDSLIGADLLTLASCASVASMDWFSDDETNLVSLCLAGGARAVAATLWPINDLVGRLYTESLVRGLLAGNSRVQAHADAQRAIMASELSAEQVHYGVRLAGHSGRENRPPAAPEPTKLAHPHYWAPFILSGAWR
ncbi:MAG TPA: CHAT domain-containing protein [Rhizomicrobium sp.]